MGLTPSPMRLGLAASNLDPASSLDSKLRHGARQSGTCKGGFFGGNLLAQPRLVLTLAAQPLGLRPIQALMQVPDALANLVSLD
jgi:hypothetical protein